ncbi:MAG: DUF167 domain-containing protein [bacterium]|nr:DUF167 domain-containing protein [bacterium]MDA1292285.1 DUF167 domain-containing protein [bacterium]
MLESLISELAEKDTVQFYVRVRSGMAKTEVQSIMDDESVKIHVAAIAENGKANAELKRYLAQEFGVAKEQVKMLSGATTRVKLIRIIRP